jgi:hypothetical protein
MGFFVTSIDSHVNYVISAIYDDVSSCLSKGCIQSQHLNLEGLEAACNRILNIYTCLGEAAANVDSLKVVY